MLFKHLLTFTTINILFQPNKASNLLCNTSEQCRSSTVSCVEGEDCFVDCMADRACWNATIDCPSTSHNCFIYCAEYYACKYATINSSSSNGNLTVINIDSSQSDWLLRGTKIYCPNGGSCSVNCAGSVAAYGGCSEMTVYGQHAKRVYIDTGKGGANGLRWTKIYCPHNSNGAECTIVIQNTGYSYQMKGMQIYAIGSLNDVSVTCKPTTTHCYPADDPPIMHYHTPDYTRSCTMDLVGQDQWNCFDPRTTYPTLEPTALPSVAPSGVSLHPSAAPSSSPTQAPSTAPTGPSAQPTTRTPTEPTNTPTKTPTYATPVITNCTNETERVCYYVDIHPIPGVVQSRLISIQDIDHGAIDTYYDIYVTPTINHCVDASVTLTYEQIDYDGGGTFEGLDVIRPSGTTITTCSSTNDCGSFASCVTNQTLGVTKLIADESNLLVTLKVSYGVDDLCTSYHNYAINARLTIFCSDATAPPTTDPTAAPSSPPTASPSRAPTKSPSSLPTTSPSSAPTAAPSSPPTRSPSSPPTRSPSSAPTRSPSTPPTTAPSRAPTTAPSALTSAPTTSPSSAPFHCADYEDSSNNGTNETSFRYQTVNESQYTVSMDENSQYFITNQSNSYVMETIQCNEISDCWVECNVRGSCILATIEIGVNTNGTSFISCSEDASCFGMTITTRAEARMNVIDVICEQKNSCSQMIINISDFDSFNLYCVGHGACEDAAIELHSSSNDTRNDGIIHCISPNSCDDLNIKTNSRRTQLKLFEHSNNVKFDNGIGYLFAIENIFCNNDKFIRLRSWINETEDTITESISSEYEAASYPCDGLLVKCGDFECTMQYNIQSQSLVQPLNDLELPHMDCYWINVQEIQRVSCVGECASSPTLQPTSAPSNAPTEITENPTYSPSKSPSISPSSFPTVSPTTAPTVAPSASPSTSPSSAPTLAPSLYPTMSPTKAPSSFPTISPTIAPSVSPSVAPSLSPTISPTKAPSLNPSHSPSQPPTISPTVAPSISPSGIPTGSPTMTPSLAPISSKDFDSYIIIIYVLQGLHEDDIDRFVTHKDTTIAYIETSIKAHYFDPGLLSYAQFMVTIVSVDDVDIKDIDSNTRIQWINLERLEINTKIECDREPINYCESVKQQSQTQNTFARSLRDELRQFFDNEDLVVSVNSPEALTIQCKDCVDGDDQFIYMGIAIVCGVLVFASICAFLFNKRVFPNLPGFHPVDEARWISLIVFAVQFWDFASDANLVSEIWSRPDVHDNVLILYSAYGATTFTAVPYIANLVIASRIKPMVKRNAAASSWFQRYSAIFVLLVVLTGGCYPALSLVSSNIFGLNITSSGLTLHELKQMSNIKIYFTIFLENIPQLICQVLYCYASQQISEAVKVAFFASALSVTASTLVFLIDRDTHDMIVVEYFLSTQCDRHRYSQNVTIDDEPDNAEGAGARTISAPIEPDSPEPLSGRGPSLTAVDQIDDEERNKFISNRGRTEALSVALAELFEMPPKNIEVGYSTLTSCGIVTHIVHYVSQAELDALEEELQKQHEDESASAPYLTRHLYALERKSVRAIFTRHFALNDDFMVEYMTKYSGVRTAARIRAASEKQNDDRSNLFRRMVTHGRLSGETVHDAMSQMLVRYDIEQDIIDKMVEMLPTTASLLLNSDGRVRDEREIEMAEIGRNESVNQVDLEEVRYMDGDPNHGENSSVGGESRVILNDDEINAILDDVDDVENEMDENV
eukprot:777780_1